MRLPEANQPNLFGPIALFYLCGKAGVDATIDELARLSGFDGRRVSLAGLAEAAKAKGLRPKAARANIEWLRRRGGPLVIECPSGHFAIFLGWNQGKARLDSPPDAPSDVARDWLERNWTGHRLIVEADR